MSRKGNTNREVHGGAGAERALSTGAEFHGIAEGVLQEVKNEYSETGVVAMLEDRSLRLQSVADIYYQLILGGLEAKDVNQVDRYVQRYGWIQNSAIRALLALREIQGKEGKVSAADVLSEIGGENDRDK